MNSELLELMNQRDAMEKEFLQLSQTLEKLKGKTLDKDLVDKEGFPRADLDFGELTLFK